MSNLSDLLPSGAGGKSFDFVASGTLANGQAVGLRSDGKVQAIAGVTQVLGTKAAVASTTLGYYNETAFDSVNNKIVLIYSDGNNSYYPYVVIGTVSTNTISFGTPVVVQSSTGYNTCIAYDANAQKIVVVYGNTSNYINSAVGTVSGTSISFGSVVTVASVNGNYNNLYYDPNSTKVVTCYRNGSNSSYGTANVGTVSGTSISWGTAVIFQSAYTQYIGIGEGTGTKVGLAYENANFTRSKYRQGTVSGTSISFDTEIEYVARTVYGVAFVNNLPQDRVVFFYQNQIDNRLYVIVGTGDPVTFGTPTVVSAGSLGADFGAAYDSDADLICVAYRDQNSGAGNTGYLTYQTGTFSSATEVTMGAAQTINAVSSTRSVLTYDTNADRIVVSFDEDTAGSGQANPKAFTILNASTNATSFVGITEAAIANAATGAVTLQGGINTTAITNTATTTFAITVANPGAGNRYYIDGALQATVSLSEGRTYKFDQSDGTNGGHPLRFSTTSDGSHGGGSEYTTGVTVVGVPGNAGAYTQIVVAIGAPTLYYYCTAHSGMGGTANTPDDARFTVGSTYYVQNDGTLGTGSTSIVAGEALSATSINLVNT